MRRERVNIRSILIPFGGLVVLNGMLSMYTWLPEYRILSLFKPSVELAVIYLLIFGISLLRPRISRILTVVLTLPIIVLFFYSLGETVTRHLYRRSFNPWDDLRYFPEFIRLLFETRSTVNVAFYITASGIVLLMICTGIYYLLSRINTSMRALRHPLRALTVFYGLFFVMVITFGYGYSFRDNLFTRIASAWHTPESAHPGPLSELHTEELPLSEENENSLCFLQNRNVLLFVIESYGYTAFAKEEHFTILCPFFENTEKKLRASGYHVRSHFLGSPVIGGYSWFADATFLTGIRINSTDEYNRLLSSDRPTLVDFFNDSGYKTAHVAPGTLKPWPEGERFYEFDRYLYAADFDYTGPDFSFVSITDQFAVHTAHETLIRESEGEPIFIEYLLVSSHAPFSRIPSYINEWSELGDGSIYYDSKTLHFQNTWVHGREYTEGYTAAVRYVLTVLSEYLSRFIHDDSLVILIGDHQPKFPVTEKGQPLSVPVHIICRDRNVVDLFSDFGFHEGMVPAQKPPHPGMETFFPLFLRIFSGTESIGDDQ